MRIKSLRYVPLLATLAATFMFFITAAPSQAATRAVAASPTASLSQGAPKTEPQVPLDHEGVACRTVHSTPHNRTGRICVMLNFDDAQADLSLQALVNFSVKSGKIKKVCANHLNLWDNGSVVRSVSFKCKKGGGQKNFISTKWWPVTPPFLNHIYQAGVYKPCIYWTDGGKACISGHWLKGPKYWD